MAEIDDKKLKGLEKILNDNIADLLYGGSTDPGWTELASAAVCVKTLQVLGLKIKHEESVRKELGGENVENQNFLKTFKVE